MQYQTDPANILFAAALVSVWLVGVSICVWFARRVLTRRDLGDTPLDRLGRAREVPGYRLFATAACGGPALAAVIALSTCR